MINDITADANQVVCNDSISTSKTLFGQDIPIIGAQINSIKFTIGVLAKHFGTIFHLLFHDIPPCPNPGVAIPLNLALTLSSHMIRLANLIPPLLPFSRGIAFNTRGVPYTSSKLHLNTRSIADIWMWRTTLYYTLYDSRWLSVPMNFPLLLRRLPDEDNNLRATRQSLLAHYNIYADACTNPTQTITNGLGVYIPNTCWLSSSIPELTHYYSYDNILCIIDINVVESIALIIAYICILHTLVSNNLPIHTVHIHGWTDNTSCKSWLTKYKTTHPLHCFLLQVFSHLQTRFGFIATVGHIAGKKNIYADAASRHFHCPNSHNLKAHLLMNQQFPVCQQFINRVLYVAMTPTQHILHTTLQSLTALEEITTFISATKTI